MSNYSLLPIHYSILTIHYSLHATHHSPLTSYYLTTSILQSRKWQKLKWRDAVLLNLFLLLINQVHYKWQAKALQNWCEYSLHNTHHPLTLRYYPHHDE